MSTIDAQGNLHDRAGLFSQKQNSAPAGGLTLAAGRDLSGEDPRDIDAELAELYGKQVALEVSIEGTEASSERYRKYIAREARFPSRVADYERLIDQNDERIAEAQRQLEANREEARPLEAEFHSRGGWTRAFLATSSNGHVHSSMDCSTCNKMGKLTRFAWMTDYSDQDEQEIVAAAGERACTTCYPSAPVEILSRPTKMFSPDEVAAAAARAERDAAKAAKQAAAAEKAITSPDGTPLRAPGRYGDTIRTLVSAERELTRVLADYIAYDGERSSNQEWAAQQREWTDALISAIAAKKGLTADAVREECRAKAFAKLKREGWS